MESEYKKTLATFGHGIFYFKCSKSLYRKLKFDCDISYVTYTHAPFLEDIQY